MFLIYSYYNGSILVREVKNMRLLVVEDEIHLLNIIKKRLTKEHYSVDTCSDGEEAMEYIREDEYLEITPQSLRIRKIILDEKKQKRASKNEEE